MDCGSGVDGDDAMNDGAALADYGIKIGKDYLGSDGHHRRVDLVEYHFGNVQVKVFDGFFAKAEWMSLPEWYKVNPDNAQKP